MSVPAKIAACIIVFAIAGLLFTSIWAKGATGGLAILLIALRHGFEGALVGGVCDFIAVRQVYSKAENNFNMDSSSSKTCE